MLLSSSVIFCLSKCISKEETNTDLRGEAFAGAATCAGCHRDISNSYMHTAHNNSSATGSAATIRGSFHKDSNRYYYGPQVEVRLEDRDSGFYQVAYQNNTERQAARMDLVIGSGRKAQTYLYWLDDKIFQLPVSYFLPVHSWVNSPGYPPKQVRFDRNIPIGCFECHSSHISIKRNEVQGDRIVNVFQRNSIIYGIDCESCHGPAAKHVSFHKDHPEEKKANYIVAYATLQRQQQVDICARCHSGVQENLKPAFKFRPGELLANNYFASVKQQDPATLDVHGNQTQLMMASPCYTGSNTLTCTTCHNSHQKEREQLPVFSQRCMTCHSPSKNNFCKKAAEIGPGIVNNCIDCHMPEKPSRLITLLSNGQPSPIANKVRTHFIGVHDKEGGVVK